MNSRTIAAAVMMLSLTATAGAQQSIDSTLRAVQDLYRLGSYTRAELEARRLVDNPLTSDSLQVIAEQWVAFSLVAQGHPALAKEHFLEILRRQPGYDLDPVQTSPKILTVFAEARSEMRSAPAIPVGRPSRLSGSGGATFRTVLFPGWEQLYQGRTTAGAILLGAGIATLGTAITLEFLRADARSRYLSASSPEEIEQTYRTYNRTRKAEGWTFAAFAAVYVASEIEVFSSATPLSFALEPSAPAASGAALAIRLTIP